MNREILAPSPRCPSCEALLPLPPASAQQEVQELSCQRCGRLFRARRRNGASAGHGLSGKNLASPKPAFPAPGSLELSLRLTALGALRWLYQAGVLVGSTVMIALGGFVPVLRAWLRDEIESWPDVVARLGGVWSRPVSKDPDADYGPALEPTDAPGLFQEIRELSRDLGVRPPRQIRVSYLPCCGATAWGRDQALVIGLPLLNVLSQLELRAVLAHELAHLAHGDATSAARSARFVESLDRSLQTQHGALHGPLAAWARACHHLGSRLLAPVAQGQEFRADRAAATLAGGSSAASALVQVATVQSLFREVLEHYDPADHDQPNLYAFFRAFWAQLPPVLLQTIRHHHLAGRRPPQPNSPHPSLLDRLEVVQSYPEPREPASTPAPATILLSDLEAIEQMLHNRLFALNQLQPSVFHRAGS